MSKEDDFTRIFIVILALLVVFTIVVALIARSVGLDENSGPMTDKDIKARTMPYGSVKVTGEPDSVKTATTEVPIAKVTETKTSPVPMAPSEPVATAATAPEVAEVAPAIDGRALYVACASCHDNGIANAPKLGDKAVWAPRIAAGLDTLVATALKGKGAMPPKGGRMDYSDEQIKAIVEYMVSSSQ